MTVDPQHEPSNGPTPAPARVIDVRPDVAANGEPFLRVLAAAVASTEGDTFVVISPFEMLALYPAMAARGFAYQSEHVGPGEWLTRFTLLRAETAGPAALEQEARSE
jgi:hypothetical protein